LSSHRNRGSWQSRGSREGPRGSSPCHPGWTKSGSVHLRVRRWAPDLRLDTRPVGGNRSDIFCESSEPKGTADGARANRREVGSCAWGREGDRGISGGGPMGNARRNRITGEIRQLRSDWRGTTRGTLPVPARSGASWGILGILTGVCSPASGAFASGMTSNAIRGERDANSLLPGGVPARSRSHASREGVPVRSRRSFPPAPGCCMTGRSPAQARALRMAGRPPAWGRRAPRRENVLVEGPSRLSEAPLRTRAGRCQNRPHAGRLSAWQAPVGHKPPLRRPN
jgi:hypothetical protein